MGSHGIHRHNIRNPRPFTHLASPSTAATAPLPLAPPQSASLSPSLGSPFLPSPSLSLPSSVPSSSPSPSRFSPLIIPSSESTESSDLCPSLSLSHSLSNHNGSSGDENQNHGSIALSDLDEESGTLPWTLDLTFLKIVFSAVHFVPSAVVSFIAY
jgi:hypothetical protein